MLTAEHLITSGPFVARVVHRRGRGWSWSVSREAERIAAGTARSEAEARESAERALRVGRHWRLV